MTWKVRHQGSPESVELSQPDLSQQLLDGQWEPTDEVMGPDDRAWVEIDNHPALAEIAADMEPPPPRHYDDETHLDMTALIDVTLVLLIFFILTTTMALIQKRMEAPSVQDDKGPSVAKMTEQQVEQQLIHVKVTMEGGKPIVLVEKEPVEMDKLVAALRRFARSSGKTDMLLEHDDKVDLDTVVQIIDKAKGAGMNKVRMLVP
jgi:biopolymer transport protein ExbD